MGILKGPFQQKELHVSDDGVQQLESHDNEASASAKAEHFEVVRESWRKERADLEEDRKKLAANSGATDLQKLLAERLERTRSLKS